MTALLARRLLSSFTLPSDRAHLSLLRAALSDVNVRVAPCRGGSPVACPSRRRGCARRDLPSHLVVHGGVTSLDLWLQRGRRHRAHLRGVRRIDGSAPRLPRLQCELPAWSPRPPPLEPDSCFLPRPCRSGPCPCSTHAFTAPRLFRSTPSLGTCRNILPDAP